MHASIFSIDLGSSTSVRERGQCGRSLASALSAVPGFVAFIALEADDGAVAGLCICMDAAALDDARQVAEAWRHECDEHAQGMQPLIEGEVIAQRGF